MVTESKATRRKKRDITLKVIKVEYVQVPDAKDRLSRVFKILLSSLNEIEEKR